MATKQEIYTAACYLLGQRDTLVNENTKTRRVLDGLYDRVIAHCLAEGSWNFAMETVELAADTGVTPNFGEAEVFAKPSDWVRTHAISGDEHFYRPLRHYVDEGGNWLADITPIYVRYVSNDTGLGLDLASWGEFFQRYVELELAERACMPLTQDAALHEKLEKQRDKARLRAKNQDAMDEYSTKRPHPGSWTTSRYGRWGSDRTDGGSDSNLTG